MEEDSIYTSCKTSIYIAFNIVMVPITMIFILAGLLIRARVMAYKPQTEYEAAMHALQKDKFLKQLWYCILTFALQITYDLIYSISLRYAANACTKVSDSKLFNNIVWFVSRGVQNVFWIYPFMYIFWPRSQVI